MVETGEIIRLVRRIDMESENFIPCVASEIESKSVTWVTWYKRIAVLSQK